MPVAIEAKLSSSSTISAASRATSVPLAPIAMPTSAALSAGVSLTPSPVMATTSPRRLSAATIFIFCSGVVREKTVIPSRSRSTNCCSRSRSRSAPCRIRCSAGSSGRRMPQARATASAVSG